MRWSQHRPLRNYSVDFPSLWKLLFTPVFYFLPSNSFEAWFSFTKSMLILPLSFVCIHYPGNTRDLSHWKSISGSVSEGVSDFTMCRPKQQQVTLLGCCVLLAKPCFLFGHPWAACGRTALSGSVLWRGHASPVRSQWIPLCCHGESFLRGCHKFLPWQCF